LRAKNGSESGLRGAVSYRFGFNGKEKVDELYESSGSAYDFGARMYDSRLGRFMSLDPLKILFDYKSNYSFADNSPIDGVDYNGNFRISSKLLKRNKYLASVVNALHNLANQDDNTVLNNEFFTVFINNAGLSDASDEYKLYYIREIFTNGRGPSVSFAPGLVDKKGNSVAGITKNNGSITLNGKLLSGMKSKNNTFHWSYMVSTFYTFWHEGIHYALLIRTGATDNFDKNGVPVGTGDCQNCCAGAVAEKELGVPGADHTGNFDMTMTGLGGVLKDGGLSTNVSPFEAAYMWDKDIHLTKFNIKTLNSFFWANRSPIQAKPNPEPESEPEPLPMGNKLILGTEGY